MTGKREDLLLAFGKNLKRLREERGLTQDALSYMSDLSRSYYAEVEQGKRNPSLINLKKLADALKISMSNLLDF